MAEDELNNEYFEWLYQLVCDETYSRRRSYRKLLGHMHMTPFVYTIRTDGNRAEDGIGLRYRFGYEHKIDDRWITAYLDNRPCSILEMMVALAVRCEDHIMGDPDIGNRTGQWFWNMVVNLGLSYMTDENYNRDAVSEVLNILLSRQYQRNGKGGLFTVKNEKTDLREIEIWYQMCWYLDDILE